MIYFLQAGDGGHVKIGWTKDEDSLGRRVKTLQIGQPLKLSLLRTLDAPRWAEGWLHALFEVDRCEGEWFLFNPQMLTASAPEERPLAEDESSFVNVRIPQSLWERLRLAAKRERRSSSSQLAITVERALSLRAIATAALAHPAPARTLAAKEPRNA